MPRDFRTLSMLGACCLFAGAAFAQDTATSAAVRISNPDCLFLYPLVSMRLREAGAVTVSGTVDAGGAVASAKIDSASGYDRLDQAALQCVWGWVYTPAKKDGSPVEGNFKAQITWQLAPQNTSEQNAAVAAADNLLGKSPDDVTTILHRAGINITLGKTDLALADFNKAIQLAPNDKAIYFALAWAQEQQKDTAGSQATLDKLVALMPGNILPLKMRAALLLSHVAAEETLKDYNEILTMEPADRGTHLARSTLLLALKQNTEARSDLDAVLLGSTSDAMAVTAYVNRANLSENEGRLDLATEDADHVSELRPLPINYKNSCRLRGLANRDLDQALMYCNKGLDLKPDAANQLALLDSQSVVYFRMNKFEDALAACSKALRILGSDASGKYVCGLAKKRLGIPGADSDIFAAKTSVPAAVAKYETYGLVP